MFAVKTSVRSASHSCREQRLVFMLTALQFSERLVTLTVGGVTTGGVTLGGLTTGGVTLGGVTIDTCSEISQRELTLCISIILETIHS